MIINNLHNDKTNKDYVSFVIPKKYLKPTANNDYVKVILNANYKVTVSDNKTLAVKTIIDLSKIKTVHYTPKEK